MCVSKQFTFTFLLNMDTKLIDDLTPYEVKLESVYKSKHKNLVQSMFGWVVTQK